jgi:hypothetical protein
MLFWDPSDDDIEAMPGDTALTPDDLTRMGADRDAWKVSSIRRDI